MRQCTGSHDPCPRGVALKITAETRELGAGRGAGALNLPLPESLQVSGVACLPTRGGGGRKEPLHAQLGPPP